MILWGGVFDFVMGTGNRAAAGRAASGNYIRLSTHRFITPHCAHTFNYQLSHSTRTLLTRKLTQLARCPFPSTEPHMFNDSVERSVVIFQLDATSHCREMSAGSDQWRECSARPFELHVPHTPSRSLLTESHHPVHSPTS